MHVCMFVGKYPDIHTMTYAHMPGQYVLLIYAHMTFKHIVYI